MGVFGKKKSAGSGEPPPSLPSPFRRREPEPHAPFSLRSPSFGRLSVKSLLQTRKKSFYSENDSPNSVRGLISASQKTPKASKSPAIETDLIQHHVATEKALSPTMAAIHARTLQMELQMKKDGSGAAASGSSGDREGDVGRSETSSEKRRIPASPSLSENWLIDYNSLVIGKTIGHSSFGAVHDGKLNGTKVAVKTIQQDTGSPDEHTSFENIKKEAELNCKLRHPNVVLFMGISIQSDKVCIVTELMSRGNVRDLLVGMTKGRKIRLDWCLRQQWALDTALGMGYLHSLDPPMIHRDLKTTNLLVDRGMRVKICDFGLSRFKSDKLMSAVGTVHFAAPEVLRNEKYTEKADVFSFGTVMWELWSRKCVFQGLPQISVYQCVIDGNMPEVDDTCDTGFKDIMKDCWSLDVAKRPSFSKIIDRLAVLVEALEEQ